jgi:short-subunit dehydrogenase
MTRREIRDRRALVTGASSGIGRAIALELAQQGADLILAARREDRLAALADEVRALGRRVECVPGDITDPAARQAAVERALAKFHGLDILVNNAGVGTMNLFENSDEPRLRRIMEVNFFALVEMTRASLPLLRQGTNPIVVNVSSILGHRGVPYNAEYAASKFAVSGFSESIRPELARLGIDVLVVCPGTTKTEFFDRVLHRTGEPQWPEHTPVTAEHVARATVRAMRRGKHEITPYLWGKVLCWLNRLSPRLVDYLMTRYV